MIRQKFFISFVAVILLLGAYAFYDYRSAEGENLKKTEQARLLTLNKDQIETIQILKNERLIELKRDTDGWSLVQPFKDQADNEEVDAFLSTATSENILDTVKTDLPIHWSLYGLDKPLAQITFKTTAGKSVSFEISTKKTFEQNTYLRVDGRDQIYLVSGTWQARANKIPFEFRDRHLFRHKIARVDKLRWKDDQKELLLELKQGQWILSDQPQKKLKQNSIRELLQAISEAQALNIMLERKASPAEKIQYSLNKPLAVLELQMENKSWKAVLGRGRDKGLYAAISDPVFVLKLESSPIDKLFNIQVKDLFESEKKALPANPAAASQTSVANPEMNLKTQNIESPGTPAEKSPVEKKEK